MQTIIVVLKDEKAILEDTAKHLCTYYSSIIPHVGEFLEISGNAVYEVHRVIHQLKNGAITVIVEVKKH